MKPTAASWLSRAIRERTARVGVIGLGYVGLPLAVEFAKAGFPVLGIDTDARRVRQISRGRSYIPDIPTREMAPLVRAGKLKGTADFGRLKGCDAAIICVPTPLRKSRDPDISYIVSAAEALARALRRPQVIVLESTTYPGTTRELILPLLEKTGLKVGRDFFLGFSPERIDPGNAVYTTRTIPKVVSGVTPACRKVVALLYRQIIQQVFAVSSTEVAEMVKLLENTFRSVNIGLVNELALMCHRLGVDVWEVIDAAKTKPFGFMPFYPGPGLGGHCLDGKETVTIRRGRAVEVLPLAELFSRQAALPGARVISHRSGRYVRSQGLEILAWDPQRSKTLFQNLSWLSARPYQGRMVRVWTRDGRHLTVTDRHPMLVENGGWEVRWAENLRSEDRLPVVDSLRERARCTGASVDRLERANGGREVYSVEVEGCHTFVTSYGLVVHNCIPIDPLYLSWKARLHGFEPRFIDLASQTNAAMPAHVVERVVQQLNARKKPLKGARVLILGVAYKRNVGDTRESPAVEIIELLHGRGARVRYHDPFVPVFQVNGRRLRCASLRPQILRAADCVVIVTDHVGVDYGRVLKHAQLVLDTRNTFAGRVGRSRKLVRL